MSECDHPRAQQYNDEEHGVARCGACGDWWDEANEMWSPMPAVPPEPPEDPEFRYIPHPHDGTTDGGDGNHWVGQWFRAARGRSYKVPENAGNYVSLRGAVGICEGYIETSFGHSWAYIAFMGDSIKRRWVRTCYLVNAETGKPDDIVLADTSKATDPVTEKMAAVWTDEFAGNSGHETITGKE